jgi:hypothetical protein
MKPLSNVLYKVVLSPFCGWVIKPMSNVLYKGGASHLVHHLPTIAQALKEFIPL